MKGQSERVKSIPQSVTLTINSRAKALREAGQSVFNFSAGEPDFPTPPRICEAAIRAIREGRTKYTETRGRADLREAIASRFGMLYGVPFDPDHVVVSCGGKHALYNLFQVLIDPGDEVIVPTPCWLSYPPQIAVAGGQVVPLPSGIDDRFQIDPNRLQTLIGPRTKAIVLNSPSNPTGAVYRAKVLRAVADLALRHDFMVVSDDLYAPFVYDGKSFVSILHECPELADRTVLIGGVSKAYAMTGWRLGYALGPKPLMTAMATLQSQSTSNASSISQAAALEALTGDGGDEEVAAMVATFEKRRNVMIERLREIPGIRCAVPEGAFYAFPEISAYVGTRTPAGSLIQGSLDLAEYLLEAGIALVPGIAFGDDHYLRLSYACDECTIEEGLGRLKTALTHLVRPNNSIP